MSPAMVNTQSAKFDIALVNEIPVPRLFVILPVKACALIVEAATAVMTPEVMLMFTVGAKCPLTVMLSTAIPVATILPVPDVSF